MHYTIEASGSGNFVALEADSYRHARRLASDLKNGLHSSVQIIKGWEVEYDFGGFANNILDLWRKDGRGKWHRCEA